MENGKLFNIDPSWLRRTDEDDVFFVQSGSNPDDWYRVAHGKCSCLGFEHRGNCRHIKQLVAEGLIVSDDIPDAEMMRSWVRVKVDQLGDVGFATARYQVKSLADSRVVPVRTSQGWPKFELPYSLGFSIESVMPEWWMLKLGTNKEYMDAYISKLRKVGIDAILNDIQVVKDVSGGRVPVLLCYEDIEKKGQWCHRRVLSDFIMSETGEIIPELVD